jgi:integrase
MKDSIQNKVQVSPKWRGINVHRRILHLLSPEQARTLLAAGKGHPHEVLLMLSLVLGLRAGELRALQWQAIDWEVGSLSIRLTRPAVHRGTAPSLLLPAKHPRTILLPHAVRDCLQAHALRQQQACARAGTRWQQQDLVMCTEQGHSLSSDRLTPLIQDLLHQAHLPVLQFHELRHTTAHLLLLAGIAPQLVGAILGVGVRGIAGHDQHTPFSREHYEWVRQVMENLFFVQ